jgi:hypothetical protein
MITEKIFNSKLNLKPFKYIHINKFFDHETVIKLLNNFPANKFFQKKKNFTMYNTKRKFQRIEQIE